MQWTFNTGTSVMVVQKKGEKASPQPSYWYILDIIDLILLFKQENRKSITKPHQPSLHKWTWNYVILAYCKYCNSIESSPHLGHVGKAWPPELCFFLVAICHEVGFLKEWVPIAEDGHTHHCQSLCWHIEWTWRERTKKQKPENKQKQPNKKNTTTSSINQSDWSVNQSIPHYEPFNPDMDLVCLDFWQSIETVMHMGMWMCLWNLFLDINSTRHISLCFDLWLLGRAWRSNTGVVGKAWGRWLTTHFRRVSGLSP